MKRPWALRPNENGVLTREALIEGLVDAATMLDIAGGVLTVVVGRAPTDVPGEMVMTGAVLEWRDRTDAKAQPEVAVQVTPEPAIVDVVRDGEIVGQVEVDTAPNGAPIPDTARVPDKDPDDGFDFSKLEEEDVEGEPAAR